MSGAFNRPNQACKDNCCRSSKVQQLPIVGSSGKVPFVQTSSASDKYKSYQVNREGLKAWEKHLLAEEASRNTLKQLDLLSGKLKKYVSSNERQPRT